MSRRSPVRSYAPLHPLSLDLPAHFVCAQLGFPYASSDSALQLKVKIAEHEPVPVPQLRLFLNGRQLEVRIRPASPLSARGLIALCFLQDGEILSKIGIERGSVLTVVGRLRGGAKPGAKRPVVPDSEEDEDEDDTPAPKRPAAAGPGNKPLPASTARAMRPVLGTHSPVTYTKPLPGYDYVVCPPSHPVCQKGKTKRKTRFGVCLRPPCDSSLVYGNIHNHGKR